MYTLHLRSVITSRGICDQAEPDPRKCAALCQTVQAIDWTPLYSLPTCHDQFFMFDAVFSSFIDEHLPIKTVKRNTNDQPWVNDELIGVVRQKSGRAEAISLSLW